MSTRTNYQRQIEQRMHFLQGFFKEHELNMTIYHYTGFVLPGLRLVNNDTKSAKCVSFDSNKSKFKALASFYNILFVANITDPDVILKVFASFDN